MAPTLRPGSILPSIRSPEMAWRSPVGIVEEMDRRDRLFNTTCLFGGVWPRDKISKTVSTLPGSTDTLVNAERISEENDEASDGEFR